MERKSRTSKQQLDEVIAHGLRSIGFPRSLAKSEYHAWAIAVRSGRFSGCLRFVGVEVGTESLCLPWLVSLRPFRFSGSLGAGFGLPRGLFGVVGEAGTGAAVSAFGDPCELAPCFLPFLPTSIKT